MNLINVKKITIAFALICLFESARCQENYLSGYVITSNKDTLKGFIDYRNWTTNPKEIFFKEKLTNEKYRYTPQSIKGFGVADEFYVSAIVKIEIDQPNEFAPQIELKTDTAFLQTIVQGAKSLYYYLPVRSRAHFYIKQDSSFELLIYKKFIMERSTEKFESKNNRYYGQLSLYLNNCEAVQKAIKYMDYTKKDLEDLFTTYYNKCTQTKIKFEKKTEKATVEFGAVAGPVLNSIKFSGDATGYLENTNYKPTINFSGGLFLETTFPRLQKKWSVYNELLFTSSKFNGTSLTYADPATPDVYTITHTKIGFSYLKLNNMIRYKYPIKNFRLFINSGFSIGYMLSDKNYKKQDFSYNSTPYESTAFDYDAIRKIELSYIIGIGTMLKKYSFEIRYEYGNGMSDYIYLKSSTNRLHFLFGYKI